jgi:hypothetical protein
VVAHLRAAGSANISEPASVIVIVRAKDVISSSLDSPASVVLPRTDAVLDNLRKLEPNGFAGTSSGQRDVDKNSSSEQPPPAASRSYVRQRQRMNWSNVEDVKAPAYAVGSALVPTRRKLAEITVVSDGARDRPLCLERGPGLQPLG